MDRRQIGTKLTLDALGVRLQLDEFSDRLIVQKSIYLAQAAGVDLGYYFQWYLRGPYSPGLTRDVFSLEAELAELAEGSDESQGWTLDEASSETLRKLRGLITGCEEQGRARRLELLASVHFLVTRRQVPPDDPGAVLATLKRFNKDYSSQEVEAGLRHLREHELLCERSGYQDRR